MASFNALHLTSHPTKPTSSQQPTIQPPNVSNSQQTSQPTANYPTIQSPNVSNSQQTSQQRINSHQPINQPTNQLATLPNNQTLPNQLTCQPIRKPISQLNNLLTAQPTAFSSQSIIQITNQPTIQTTSSQQSTIQPNQVTSLPTRHSPS